MGPDKSGNRLDGDRVEALRSLFASYRRPLSRYFRRHASAQDIPDLVQEVFLRLSRMNDPATISDRSRFIFVIAANVLRDEARYAHGRVSDVLQIEEMELEGSDFLPDRVLESRQAAQLVRQALSELPERTRDVFVLRLLEGWKMIDVARSIGISMRAAEKHQARALAHVAGRMKDWRRD